MRFSSRLLLVLVVTGIFSLSLGLLIGARGSATAEVTRTPTATIPAPVTRPAPVLRPVAPLRPVVPPPRPTVPVIRPTIQMRRPVATPPPVKPSVSRPEVIISIPQQALPGRPAPAKDFSRPVISTKDNSLKPESALRGGVGDSSRNDIRGGQVSDKLGNKGIDPASLGVLQGGGREGLGLGGDGEMLPDMGGPGSTPDFDALGGSGDRASRGGSSGYGVEEDPGEHPAGEGVGRFSQGALEDAIGAGRNSVPTPETVGPTGSFSDPRGTPSAGGLGADPRIGSVLDTWDAPNLDFDNPDNRNIDKINESIREQELGRSGGLTKEQIEREAQKQLVEGTGYEKKTAEQINKDVEKQQKEGRGGNSGSSNSGGSESGNSGGSETDRPENASPPPPAITPNPEGGEPETIAGKKFKQQIEGIGKLNGTTVVSPQDTLIDPGPDGGGSAYREKGRPNLEKAIEQGLDPYIYNDDTGSGAEGGQIKKSVPDTLIDPPKPDTGVDGGPTGGTSGVDEVP